MIMTVKTENDKLRKGAKRERLHQPGQDLARFQQGCPHASQQTLLLAQILSAALNRHILSPYFGFDGWINYEKNKVQ